MELLAVALDDEPSVDEQVDTPHTVDTDLQLDTAAQLTQKQTNQRLGPRFRTRIQQWTEGSEAMRDAREDFGDVRFIDKSEVPGVVDSGDSGPRRLASDRLGERLDDIDCGTIAWCRRWTPVVDDVAGCRRSTARQRVLLHVAVRMMMDEHPAHGQQADAVQPPAQTRRRDDVAVRSGRDEPPLPHTSEAAVCDSASESAPRPSGGQEFARRPHRLLVLFGQGNEGRHPPTLADLIAVFVW